MQHSVTLSSCTARSQGTDCIQSQPARLLAGWDCADSMESEEQPCSKQDRQIFFCSTAFPVQGRQTEAWEQTAEVYTAEQQLQFLSEMY